MHINPQIICFKRKERIYNTFNLSVTIFIYNGDFLQEKKNKYYYLRMSLGLIVLVLFFRDYTLNTKKQGARRTK